MIWDWLRGKEDGGEPVPRGSVIEAGIPNQERVDHLPLPEMLFLFHYQGFAKLPDDSLWQQKLLHWARQAEFLRALPRQSARDFLQESPIPGIDEQTLTSFFQVLFSEITRRLYIQGARQRPGVVGLRLSLVNEQSASPAARAIVAKDAFGLGQGVYPLTQIPENPDPGRENPFILRVLYNKDDS